MKKLFERWHRFVNELQEPTSPELVSAQLADKLGTTFNVDAEGNGTFTVVHGQVGYGSVEPPIDGSALGNVLRELGYRVIEEWEDEAEGYINLSTQ